MINSSPAQRGAARVLLLASMALIAWSFVVSGAEHSFMSKIYWAAVVTMYARMLWTGRVSRYRSIFQFVFAALFAVSFIGIMIDERGSMSMTTGSILNAETPFCQITVPLMLIPFALVKTVIFPARIDGHFASVLAMFIIWLLSVVSIGRGWCSWVCFYGGWEEGASSLSKKARLPTLDRNKDFRAIHFGFLVFIVLASLTALSAVYCEWFCPFKLVTEFAPVTDFVGLLGALMFISMFIGLVVVLPILTKKRVQCGTLCPFGSFQSLMDRFSLYRIVIDADKCVSCMKCASACKFFSIDRETITEKKGAPELTCSKCGACVEACPTGAIRYEYSFTAKKGSCASKGNSNPFLSTLLDPKNLFVFTAFSFGVAISSRFVPDGIYRIVSVFIAR